MAGDEPVAPLGDAGEDRPVFIPIQQPSLTGLVGERTKDRLRAAIDVAVLLNQLHGRLELAARHLGKPSGHRRILKRKVIKVVARSPLPTVNPQRAELAVAVVDHHRLRRGRRYLDPG